jgi:hypothetical protein
LAASVLTVALVNWKPGETLDATKKATTTVADNRPALKDASPASPVASVAPADAKTRGAKADRAKVVAGKPAGPAPPPAPASAPAKDAAEPPKQAETPSEQSSANTARNTASTGGGPGNTRSDGENAQQQNVGQQAGRDQRQSVGGQAKEQAQAPAPASMARTAGFLARPSAERGAAAPLTRSLLRGEADGRESELAAGVRPRTGDRVRLRLTTSAAGYVEVSLRDSSGAWQPRSKRIAVVPNAVYTIPDTPLEVTPGETLRLTWSPEDAATDELRDSVSTMRKTKERLETKAAPPASSRRVVTDIPLH